LLRTELTAPVNYAKSRWPLSPILATDFISTLKDETMGMADLKVEVADCDARCMIRVDSFSLVLAMAFILECLKKECHSICDRIRLTAPGNLVQMDLIWQGKPIKIEMLRQWNELHLAGCHWVATR
jgi:hypothetical protein